MAKTAGDTITELDYNALQTNINAIMGTPSGTTETDARGYNQTLSSAQISVGDKVTEVQWDNLRSDIDKAYTHQFGSSSGITDVSTSTTITAADYNAYETTISTVSSDPNRYTVASGQTSTVAGITGRKNAGWNGTETHQFTCTWSSANERKAFFNAGGQIRIFVSNDYTGTEAKTRDWKHILNDAGQMYFNYKLSARVGGTGSASYYGTGSTYGNYDITSTTWRTLWTANGANPYAENDIAIQVRQNSTSQLEFRCILRDDDAGDRPVPSPPPPYGPLVDETVKGTTTSTVTVIKPNGSNVSVPAPTFAHASGNTFTN